MITNFFEVTAYEFFYHALEFHLRISRIEITLTFVRFSKNFISKILNDFDDFFVSML